MLENRLIKQLRPPGNIRLARARRPARLHPLPPRHPVSDPRGLAAPGGGSCGDDRSAARPTARAASSSSNSTRCSGCATAAGGSCAASIRPPTGRWAAACRRASATSTRTSTGGGSTRRSRLFVDGGEGGQRLIDHVDAPDARGGRRAAVRARRVAAPARPPARGDPGAAGGRRSRRPTPVRGSLLAAHPGRTRAATRSGSPAAGSSTGGRSPRIGDELDERTSAALRSRRPGRRARGSRPSRRGRRGADPRRPTWRRTRRAPQLALDPAPDAGALESFAYGETSLSGRTAARRPPPELPGSDADVRPGGASRRTSASADRPELRRVRDAAEAADGAALELDLVARLRRRRERRPRRWRLGLPR